MTSASDELLARLRPHVLRGPVELAIWIGLPILSAAVLAGLAGCGKMDEARGAGVRVHAVSNGRRRPNVAGVRIGQDYPAPNIDVALAQQPGPAAYAEASRARARHRPAAAVPDGVRPCGSSFELCLNALNLVRQFSHAWHV